MKTPRERYLNDAQYRALVDIMEAHLHMAHFNPSEMREAAMMASINFEMRRIRPILITPEVESAIKTLQGYVNKEDESAPGKDPR